ncbi:MAG: type IV-A pilus assembly ATPase PilB [Candidatus Wallbacteria bacterium]|nr:type IV-A pilus assembly ATPase PilB [Candidatus Wallbacteria bacterium]
MALPPQRPTKLRLGEVLIANGLITQEQLKEAIARQKQTGKRLGSILVEMRVVTERDITEVLSKQLNVPFIDLSNYLVDPAIAKLIPEHIAERHQLIPINKVGNKLTVAMVDPLNILAIDDIALMTGLQVKTVVATPSDVTKALQEAYGAQSKMDDLMDDLVDIGKDSEKEELGNLDGELGENDAPIIRLCNLIISQAVSSGVSDIHIEPFEKELRIRYRQDGVLYNAMTPPKRAQAAISSRLKIMASLDIAEKRLPQDGRIKIKVNNRAIDLRVSTLPTVWGEKIVMRILDQTGLRVNLEDLGFEPSTFERFKKGIAVPYGIILVTGPTGSGKTTTLYSALSTLNEPKVNIMTAEDPVEYQLTGINQVQCRPDIGLTFAAALRSFLRQDPDIIMVGEIRDRETAEIAIKASMTGHLVLSTLHTNDAPSTIARLIDMGIEGFMVTSSVVLVQAQRLVRTICKDCKMEYRPKKEMIDGFGITADLLRRLDLPHIDEKNIKFYKGKGCESCGNDGYRGRMGIYEVMEMTENMRQCILKGGSTTDMSRLARTEGMLTLRESAVRKALLGMTTVEEVVRVTAADR